MRSAVLPVSASLCVALLSSASLSAQTTVMTPDGFANREGQSGSLNRPFAYGVGRNQYHYYGNLLPLPNAAQVRAVGFRQDGNPSSLIAESAMTVQMEAFMGNTSKSGTQITSNYANNYDGAPTNVFALRLFNLPARPVQSTTPTNQITYVPLDAPFQFDSSKNLIFDLIINANANNNTAFRYTSDIADHKTVSSAYGASCNTSTALVPLLAANAEALGDNWIVSLSRAPRSAGAALAIGLGNTTYQGLPLPFDMGILGAPGCTIHVDMVVNLTRFLTSSGTASWSLPTPNDLSIDGVTFYAQAFMVDLFANNLGLISSNGVRTTFSVPTRQQFVGHTGNPAQTTGSVSRSYGMVTYFQY
jgi:hypothetical protein